MIKDVIIRIVLEYHGQEIKHAEGISLLVGKAQLVFSKIGNAMKAPYSAMFMNF